MRQMNLMYEMNLMHERHGRDEMHERHGMDEMHERHGRNEINDTCDYISCMKRVIVYDTCHTHLTTHRFYTFSHVEIVLSHVYFL